LIVLFRNFISIPFRRYGGTSVLAVLAGIAIGCKDQGPGCTDTLSITASIAEFYATEPFNVAAKWSGTGSGCPNNFAWSATPPLGFVSVTTGQTLGIVAAAAGTGTLTVRAGSGDAHVATREFVIGSATGELDVEFTGLGFGATPDLDLIGPNGFTRKVTASGVVSGLPPGTYEWRLNTVTGGPLGHRWGPEAAIGNFEIFKNVRFQITIKYRRQTGQLDFVAVDVPENVTGFFARISRPNFSIDVLGAKHSVAVEPGSYTWEAFEVDSTGFRFVPNVFNGTQLVGSGSDVPLPVPYTAVRGFLILEAPGLPAGATVSGELRTPTSQVMVTVPGEEYQIAGTYALDVTELIGWLNGSQQQIEHYIPIPSTSTIQIPGGRATRISTQMHLADWRASFNSNITLVFDPGLNAGSIGFGSTLSMQAVVSAAPPPDSVRMINISGAPPWVSVGGVLKNDSTFVATGTGVVASFPDVPVTFTGRLRSDGGIEGTYQMGSDTVPKGIPSGPVRYTVEGARVTPSVASGRARSR
jgi:hypothetical protein